MAVSPDFDTPNVYIKYQITVTEVSTDPENNTSDVNIVVDAWRTNDYPEPTNYSGGCFIKIDGDGSGSDKDEYWEYPERPIYTNSHTVLYDNTLTIEHNSDGKKTVYIEAAWSLYRNGSAWFETEYRGFNVELTPLKGSLSVTLSVVEITTSSVTLRVNASESCDQWWYIRDDQTQWTKFSTEEGTFKDVTIDGLLPNTTHTFRGSAQKVNSEVYGNSSIYTLKTSREAVMIECRLTLFPEDETEFTNNGLGSLPDAKSCKVVEERNGSYELTLVYPLDGLHFSDISTRKIILAPPNKYSYPQPFRIYSISKPFDGKVTINAAHISYDLSDYTLGAFSADNGINAFRNLANGLQAEYQAATSQSMVVNQCPFEFWTDNDTEADMATVIPSTARALLGGGDNSILNVYGGELEFDAFTVKLWKNRGVNKGVTIRYGKNLTNLKQDENCSNVYTHVRPYWIKKEKDSYTMVDLPEKYVPVPGTFNYTKILPMDFSSEFDEAPSVEDLKHLTEAYIALANLGVPEVAIDVSFVDLTDTEEYKDLALLEQVKLCDIVNVEFPKLGVSATAQCVRTTFNVLTNRYTSIELGDVQNGIAGTIADQSKAISGGASRSYVENTVNGATSMLTNPAIDSYGFTSTYRYGYTSYIRMGRFYITGTYANSPIKIELYRRGEYSSIELYLLFTNVNTIDAGINVFKYFDPSGATDIEAFMLKVDTGVWELFVLKSENYDSISAVYTVPDYMKSRITLEFKDNMYYDSPPSGAISLSSF